MISFTEESSSVANTPDEKTAKSNAHAGRKESDGFWSSFDDSSMFTSEDEGMMYSLSEVPAPSHESSMILPPSPGNIADFEHDFAFPVIEEEDESRQDDDAHSSSKPSHEDSARGKESEHALQSHDKTQEDSFFSIALKRRAARDRDILEFSDENESDPFVDIESDDDDSHPDMFKRSLKYEQTGPKNVSPSEVSQANEDENASELSPYSFAPSVSMDDSSFNPYNAASWMGSSQTETNLSNPGDDAKHVGSSETEARRRHVLTTKPSENYVMTRQNGQKGNRVRKPMWDSTLLRNVLERGQVLAGTRPQSQKGSTSSKQSMSSTPVTSPGDDGYTEDNRGGVGSSRKVSL